MSPAFLRRLLAALTGAVTVFPAAAASPLPSFPMLHVSDLRPGYVVAQNVYRSPSTIAKQEPLLARLLLSHGWIGGYSAVFDRAENARIQVGQTVDRFRSVSGAHWWYQASVLRVPPGYHAVPMSKVGDESTAIQNAAFIGIIFRRGVDVFDVYVSLLAPLPRPSVLHFAELLSARTMSAAVPADLQAHRGSPTLSVRIWVRQQVMATGTEVTLYAKTKAGARCVSAVIGTRHPGYRPFRGYMWIVGADGVVRWTWRASAAARRDTVTVTCSDGTSSQTVRSTFTVRHA